MLALVVPAEIHLPLEALGAYVTSKRFEARVLPAVGDQVGALAERFAAHLAFVGLFTFEIKTKTAMNLYNEILHHLRKEAAAPLLLENQVCHLYHKWWQVFFTRQIMFAFVSALEEPCHCSDLSNIYWHKCQQPTVPFTEQENPYMQMHGDICLSFFFLIYQQLYTPVAAPGKLMDTARGAIYF